MKTFLFLLLWVLPLSHAQRKKCIWEDKENTAGVYVLNNYLTTKQPVGSGHLCKSLCTKTHSCVSVDWKATHRKCVLYKTPPYTAYDRGTLHSVLQCVQKPCTWYKRWCIKGAQCINRTCVCPPHAPKGDGAFDCVPQHIELCTVNCDPKATTWDGAVAPINLPCWYRMTDFFVHSPSLRYFYNKCRIQVHVLNQLTYRGLFFVRRVLIKVWLGRQRQYGQYSWPLYSTYAIDLDHDYVWRAMKSYDTPFDKKPVQRLLDLTIIRDFDRQGRFAVVKFKECWVRIKFRPYDPYHQPQSHKPGVTVAIPKHAEFPKEKEMSTVCLTPGQGPTAYEDLAVRHGLKHADEMSLFNVLLMGVDNQKAAIFHEHRDHCVAVVKTFTSAQCEKFRAFTIHLCAPVLNHKRLIHCFQAREVNPMEVFQQCVNWGCLGRVEECHLYSNHLYYCHSTSFMRQVGCDPAARLLLNLNFQNRTAIGLGNPAGEEGSR